MKVTPIERTALKAGERLMLEDGGRSLGAEGELRLSVRGMAKLHCRIHFRDGQWRLFHYGYAYTTFINGARRLEWVLSHGDVVELELGPVFRFLLREEGEGAPEVAEAMAEEPSSPERLAVWADHLLERGSSLGERIQTALKGEPTSPEDDRRRLGPLARVYQQARLDLTWEGGVLKTAALRDLAPFGSEPLAMVEQLVKLEVAQTLQSLWLDSAGREANATSFTAALEHAGHLPALRRVSFGDCHASEGWTASAERDLKPRLKQVCPRLEDGPLFNLFRRAHLKVLTPMPSSRETAGAELSLDQELELYDVRSAEAELGGRHSTFHVWRVRRERSRYQVHPSREAPTRLNGKPVTVAVLRDGDTLELGQGLFRFELER